MFKHIGGFFKNPVKTIIDEVARVPDNIMHQGENVANFMGDPVDTAFAEFERAPGNIRSYLKEIGDELGRLSLMGYYDFLAFQSNWKSISPELIAVLAEHYPNIDFDKVRFAENINTIHGKAITFGNDIFFTDSISPSSSKADLEWLLHELEHVSQYEKHGGIGPFLVKYVINGAISIGEKLSFSIHNDINLEKDATNKAKNIIEDVWGRIDKHSYRL